MPTYSIKEWDQLEDSFVAFAKVLLTRMEMWVSSGKQVPTKHYRYTEFYEDVDSSAIDYFQEPIEARVDYMPLLFSSSRDSIWRVTEALEWLKNWDDLIEEVFQAGEGINRKDYDPALQTYMAFTQIAVYPIIEILNRYHTFHPTSEQLSNCFSHFRDQIFTLYVDHKTDIPILNLESHLKNTETFGTFQLAPFTPDTKTDLWNTCNAEPLERGQMLSINIDYFRKVESYFTKTHRELRSTHDQQNMIKSFYENRQVLIENIAELDEIITAFHLMKPGNLKTLGFFTYTLNQFKSTNRACIYKLDNHHFNEFNKLHTKKYILEEKDIPEIKNLLSILKNWRLNSYDKDLPYGQLSVAIRRFNQAYTRSFYEDQIIDLCIALESCLLHNNRHIKKSGLLSTRGCMLLAHRACGGNVKAFLTKMYLVRNDIVHAGKNLSDLQKSPFEFTQRCEDITRCILQEYIRRLAKFKNPNLELLNSRLYHS